MQITTLILAPTFFAAALYVLLGSLINRLGRHTSIISPKAYAIIFVTCDIISLVIQAVGGAMAARAANSIDGDTKTGTNIMVAGIVFQLFTMTVFAALVMDFLRRVYLGRGLVGKGEGSDEEQGRRKGSLDRPIKLVLVSLFVSFVMIYVRSIYRTIELAEGWTGYLMKHEGYFIGLDATLMVVAVGVFLVFDPAVLLKDEKTGSKVPGSLIVEVSDTSDGTRKL